jgi:2-amino-4-hydroxy-6-hydroxymethyldihydropteridine diphosphokinase
MHIAYILLGSNMGDSEAFLKKAIEQILIENCVLLKASSIYKTAPWGNEDQAEFLNQVIMIRTSYNATDLLKRLLQIEIDFGRIRNEKMGPRTIDLDILFYDQMMMDTDELTLPHPQIQNRRFVLIPLCEIVSHKIHPVFKKTIQQLLDECTDTLPVSIYHS